MTLRTYFNRWRESLGKDYVLKLSTYEGRLVESRLTQLHSGILTALFGVTV